MTTQLTPAQIAHMRAWVKALRSGEYEQGFGQLRKNSYFCCLGVACDVYRKAVRKGGVGWKLAGKSETFCLLGADTALPDNVCDWLGVECDSPRLMRDDGSKAFAIDMNDRDRMGFPQIADAIERTWPEVTP